MAVYPAAIVTTGDIADAGANLSSNPHSALHDDLRDEVIAVQTELGVDPAGSFATVRARLDGIGTATAYTPALTATTTNPTLGTGGSVSGYYTRNGQLVTGVARIEFGTSGTNAGSGFYLVSLPVAVWSSAYWASGSSGAGSAVGTFAVRAEGGPSAAHGVLQLRSTTTVGMYAHGSGVVGGALPAAFAANSRISIQFSYLAAP